jgi:beta-galactosidase
MLTAAHAQVLADWVAAGGTLISEATPGYFGDRGKVGTVQPHNGLDAVFGVAETNVEFMPDIGDRISFSFNGNDVKGGGFRQVYRTTTGRALGDFADGSAVVENDFGKGRTLLVGTHPGVAYFKASDAENLRYFAEVFVWTKRARNLTWDNPKLHVRLHRSGDAGAIWILNFTREPQRATIALGSAHEQLRIDGAYWGDARGKDVVVPPRDALVLRLTA